MAPQGGQEEMAWSKAFDFYAFSWGAPRKPARNVAETAQRKSQVFAGGGAYGVRQEDTRAWDFSRWRGLAAARGGHRGPASGRAHRAVLWRSPHRAGFRLGWNRHQGCASRRALRHLHGPM